MIEAKIGVKMKEEANSQGEKVASRSWKGHDATIPLWNLQKKPAVGTLTLAHRN